ncbi:DUF2165 domain-containing protein [Antrihabitans cavernicola]|uniref:DUF2165 domain-containing protein n=1 Tax=Antrihabitans cavernicola TaxID=2495913 RepID=A0A5A7S8Q0_9NOCA|nr:DUF2165 domain-containing protein [Spelaeibacter cavernicola]KAA0022306.1 DUF2165 domain-containing protein [Spelaeibacter cavernicola]
MTETDRVPDRDTIPARAAWKWQRLGTPAFAIGVLVFLNGIYLAFVAFGNITDFGTNQPFVAHVLSMDTTNFGAKPGTGLDDDVMWRAIDGSVLQNVAYIGVIVVETVTALVLVVAAVLWWRGSRNARPLASIGLVMMVLLFFGGFIAVGGEWFQMWKSTAWNGLEPAFRNSVLALVTLLFVHLPDRRDSSTT